MTTEIRYPAEWEPHEACRIAWPSAENLWQENLLASQKEFTAMARAIAGFGERLEVLVPTAAAEVEARQALEGVEARFHRIPFGDIWVRDTGPIFVKNSKGENLASRFGFNGWGGKYVLEHDAQVATEVVKVAKSHGVKECDWILEGGSIESDGQGTILTTRQCLMNPNRNPKLSQAEVEAKLARDLGAQKVLWVTEGLLNDHTDGHIDTITRYVAPGEVVCMEPTGRDDPNAQILERIRQELSEMTDAHGRKLRVHTIPSPGRILNSDGDVMPASHVNFYIANRGIVVPTYGNPAIAERTAKALEPIFPGRKVAAISARAILSGGGAFHCITQQQPV